MALMSNDLPTEFIKWRKMAADRNQWHTICSSKTPSQVKLLITNNAFCIVQRATAQSKTGIFRDFGVAEAPPGFQAGWSDCMYFFSLSLCSSCPLFWVSV
jgi:hypothetical protein